MPKYLLTSPRLHIPNPKAAPHTVRELQVRGEQVRRGHGADGGESKGAGVVGDDGWDAGESCGGGGGEREGAWVVGPDGGGVLHGVEWKDLFQVRCGRENVDREALSMLGGELLCWVYVDGDWNGK